MPLETTLPLYETGPACQVYFRESFADQVVFPLVPGGETRAVIIPHTGVLLLPADSDDELPLTVDAPDEMERDLADSYDPTS